MEYFIEVIEKSQPQTWITELFLCSQREKGINLTLKLIGCFHLLGNREACGRTECEATARQWLSNEPHGQTLSEDKK